MNVPKKEAPVKRRNKRFKIKHNEQFWRDLDA